MKINEAAKLAGVTVRTLRHYDKIGLLKPSGFTDSGYRVYDKDALKMLQEILFFKELDFSLSDIKTILNSPGYNRADALKKQHGLLTKKRNRLNKLIDLLENTINGDESMSIKDSFKDFDMSEIENQKKQYADEVKSRWGNTEAYRESEEKTAGYDSDKWELVSDTGADILKRFGKSRHLSTDSEEAQKLVKEWQNYITDSFYNCTDEILLCLSQMYVCDERFKENIDKNGEGTAAFMSAAIEIYCKK